MSERSALEIRINGIDGLIIKIYVISICRFINWNNELKFICVFFWKKMKFLLKFFYFAP